MVGYKVIISLIFVFGIKSELNTYNFYFSIWLKTKVKFKLKTRSLNNSSRELETINV